MKPEILGSDRIIFSTVSSSDAKETYAERARQPRPEGDGEIMTDEQIARSIYQEFRNSGGDLSLILGRLARLGIMEQSSLRLVPIVLEKPPNRKSWKVRAAYRKQLAQGTSTDQQSQNRVDHGRDQIADRRAAPKRKKQKKQNQGAPLTHDRRILPSHVRG